MNKLIQLIETTRAKIDAWRRLGLKELPTRTIVIDPLLEALGWDVRDPDEVQLEYATVDGKPVDYGLKLNRKCVLLIEAKAFDDPLTDVKAITQVVNYANNDGIVWCILTNGLTWKVYRSIESCPAPDKLMYEVSIDPRDSTGMSIQQIAEQMWRFSREEIAKGALDALGEETFTDSKVRKALDRIMVAPPRSFLNVVREATADQSISIQQIKQSLARIWRAPGINVVAPAEGPTRTGSPVTDGSEFTGSARRIRQAESSQSPYDEAHHVAGIPKEVVELYRAVDRLCLSMDMGVTKDYVQRWISYRRARVFCTVHIQRGGLRVCLKLKHSRLVNPPSFARDVSSIGHWGVGDLELAISNVTQLREAGELIRQSFEESRA